MTAIKPCCLIAKSSEKNYEILGGCQMLKYTSGTNAEV